MVAGSLRNEVVSAVPPSRLWKALIRDGYNLLPKVMPELFSTINILQGDGGVGTIKEFNFTSANKDYTYAKDRVDELDDERFVYKYTVVEGGLLGKKVSALSFEVKIEGTAEGGSHVTLASKFDTLSDSLPSQAEIDEGKAQSGAIFKAVEAYLLSNPTSYT